MTSWSTHNSEHLAIKAPMASFGSHHMPAFAPVTDPRRASWFGLALCGRPQSTPPRRPNHPPLGSGYSTGQVAHWQVWVSQLPCLPLHSSSSSLLHCYMHHTGDNKQQLYIFLYFCVDSALGWYKFCSAWEVRTAFASIQGLLWMSASHRSLQGAGSSIDLGRRRRATFAAEASERSTQQEQWELCWTRQWCQLLQCRASGRGLSHQLLCLLHLCWTRKWCQ